MNRELRMGGLLKGWQPSLAGLLYYLHAPRLPYVKDVFWSDVDLPDVSFWQDKIDFRKMKRSGVSGVFIRVGQNVWIDRCFEENWKQAQQVGLPRGSYWFYDSRVKPESQAGLYIELLRDDPGELPLVVDYEENFGGPFRGWHMLYRFLERLRLKFPHKKIWIYTGYWYWMKNSPQWNTAALHYFLQFPLWLAWYTTDPKRVRVPKPWKDAIMWQWGTPPEGKERGVSSKEIDMNKFTGNLYEFEKMLE